MKNTHFIIRQSDYTTFFDLPETPLLKGSYNPKLIHTVAKNPIGYGVRL